MEPTHGSRRPEDTAAEKTAGPGGNSTKESARSGGAQSGAPRSWRQYIEQDLPAQDSQPAAERKNVGVRQSAADRKEQIRAARERCVRQAARLARECGRKARTAAVAARKELNAAAAVCREKLGPGAKKVRAAVARHPVSPLLYVTLLAVFIGVAVFQGSYARAYVLEVNDQELGLVTGEDEANAILSSLGDDFDCDVNVTLSPVYAAPGSLTDAAQMEDALLEVVGASLTAPLDIAPKDEGEEEDVVVYITAWALSVDGEELAYAAGEDELYQMLDEIAQPWLPENAVHYEFVEDVQVYSVELPSDVEFGDLGPIREELSALRVEKAIYVVKKGDTFNAIAYSLDMWPYELAALNPDVIVDKLSIGQELIIQLAVPRLSVMAITDETYEEVIPSPVEYIETADLYVGDTKLKSKGESGMALVSAQVTYINNVEAEREILETTTLVEPTTTYTYIGTTPRPSTASNGYFIWPVRGSITSTFGYRYLFGSTDYHSGLDIAVPAGTTVKAADGGKVTYAGWMGNYGNLVIITHDDGRQTYYAHNSSLLVSAGQRVYQGQAIAKAGSTGLASGPHCHFEVRINGTSVNPRNYLS